ncbi:MAG: trypsin-like peptidase domain-containing protein [Planctomycetaceae bacterium]|nr:trypsin-like peptidase domain-containing protein [Planctomycetales bacterium]MCB9872632.1 trypsin-like peptidase domain-containing protein [Planctomycetaceae bacterium]MCB9939542.1 trypsin-like peptidase domain-containing protein [Planctomycetaceae bacterium]
MSKLVQWTAAIVIGVIGCSMADIASGQVADAVRDAEQQRIQAVAKAVVSAVAVFSADGNGGGSGVVISPDGYALTNFHVVQPVGDYMQCGMADGRLYDAVLVSIDPTGDVALIKLFGRDDFPTAELADSDDIRVGDWCFAVGNPFLLATNFEPTVTYGIVSGVHRYQEPAGTILEYTDCIQTDAAINPGNSGGPLFNSEGNLIGINGRGSFEKRGRVNVGLGYAISINQIKHFMGYLHSGRIVDHATLGATVDADEEGRVVVSNILESSDAFRRGLRYSDEVVAFGGRTIDSPNAFKNVLGIYPKGWRVPLSYLRDGTRHDIHVRLAGVHAREELLAKIQEAPTDEPPPKPAPQGEEDKPQGDGQEKAPPKPHGETAKVPDELQQYIKHRSGFANYYFNELNRSRVWNAFHDAAGDFAETRGEWRLSKGEEFSITLGNEESAIKTTTAAFSLNREKDLSEQLEPQGSGGMLATLHLWRRMLVEGPTAFGDVVYVGRAPLIGQEGLYELFQGTYDVVETHFYFDPMSGELRCVEMAPDPGVDPCELQLFDYRDVEGKKLPHRMLIRHGDEDFLDLEIQSIQLSKTAKPEA